MNLQEQMTLRIGELQEVLTELDDAVALASEEDLARMMKENSVPGGDDAIEEMEEVAK